jgi:DNA-binding CsgD family transcriptional regulator
MELIERAGYLASMQHAFQNVDAGEGHCIFVSGEAGIGKTSLVREFCNRVKNKSDIFQGTCDALFSPRPLAPLYDILLQVWNNLPEYSNDMRERTKLFTEFFFEIKNKKEISVIVFEDIHWADEATLDFIKFFGRRITQLKCLFILTYRDDEIHSRHPLRNVLGQLNPDSFTRLQLLPLSREAVEKMTEEKGYKGEDVYSVSGGNPFYVNEILASYSAGVPDNIKDSILSSYNGLDENTKHVWQILSVMPTRFEMKYLEKMEPSYAASLHNCLDLQILIPKDGLIFFKHELFRRTIENSLSPLLRIELHKKILELFKESFEQNKQIERIIHHAKNANDYDTVVKYAPLAAKHASSVGAHIEASKLYLTAIEYYQDHDENMLIQLYESYAYECYLTSQIKEAIIYEGKALNVLKEKNDPEKEGNCMRFLSRLNWIDGNRKKADVYANQAIEVLSDLPPSKSKAMAFSNMSQLKMLANEHDESILWGEKAITMAKELGDEETLAHALNNVGTGQMRILSSRQKGIELLQKSLDIAIKNSYEEHAARAYTNFGSSAVEMKDYAFAKKMIGEGIQYCEERDLDSWRTYILVYKARMWMETGNWNEAYVIADDLIKDPYLRPISKIGALVIAATIKMRRGENDFLPLLVEARAKAFETMEAQRIIPVLVAFMEYEWLTGTTFIKKEDLTIALKLLDFAANLYEKSEFDFWLFRTRKEHVARKELHEAYDIHDLKSALKAANLWKQIGCPYEEALALFEGSENDKKTAIEIIHNLGAHAVYEKMKFEMRASGIKSIPRGLRQSTMSNPANLTQRELDVLELLKEGLQNKEIADRLFVSPKTVAQHISSIFFKLDVNSRAKAVQEATRLTII